MGKPKPPDLLVVGERKEGIADLLVAPHGEAKKYNFGLGKGVVEVFTGPTRQKTNLPPHVVPPRDLLGEVPRERIASVAPARRGRKPCLRVSFVDGSGFEFFFQAEDPAVFEWMVRRRERRREAAGQARQGPGRGAHPPLVAPG